MHFPNTLKEFSLVSAGELPYEVLARKPSFQMMFPQLKIIRLRVRPHMQSRGDKALHPLVPIIQS
jgi:hypothetical protein